MNWNLAWLTRHIAFCLVFGCVVANVGIRQTRYDCDFGAPNGICVYTQDTDDDFNWTGQRRTARSRNQVDAPSDTYVCACKRSQQQPLRQGSVARFRSGIFPATGDSTVAVSFWFNIYRRDGGELRVFLVNHGSTKEKRLVFERLTIDDNRAVATTDWPVTGRAGNRPGWIRANFNESVSEPFQLIFEAQVGDTPNSGVALSNLSFTVYSPPKYTDQIEEVDDPGFGLQSSVFPLDVPGGELDNTADENTDTRPSLTFLIAIVACSTVVVIMILFVVVVVCLVRKIRILSSTAHPYEEISSTKSERGTLEPQHHKDCSMMVIINDSGSTLPRWKHISYMDQSNRSSIYAEITEAEEQRQLTRWHRSGTATTGDSFVTACSLQNLLERTATGGTTHKVAASNTVKCIGGGQVSKSAENSRRPSDSGWVDNVIYESGSDLRELTASEKGGPMHRRFTGPGSFGFAAGWMEDLTKTRTL